MIKNSKNQKYKHELYALAYTFIWLIWQLTTA